LRDAPILPYLPFTGGAELSASLWRKPGKIKTGKPLSLPVFKFSCIN
jgi:hypothetical protein